MNTLSSNKKIQNVSDDNEINQAIEDNHDQVGTETSEEYSTDPKLIADQNLLKAVQRSNKAIRDKIETQAPLLQIK